VANNSEIDLRVVISREVDGVATIDFVFLSIPLTTSTVSANNLRNVQYSNRGVRQFIRRMISFYHELLTN